jgi:hypothetical protein
MLLQGSCFDPVGSPAPAGNAVSVGGDVEAAPRYAALPLTPVARFREQLTRESVQIISLFRHNVSGFFGTMFHVSAQYFHISI